MIEVLKVVASVVLFFGGSLLVTYGVFSLLSARKHRIELTEGASVRLIGPGGAYRCHFLEFRDGSLVFSSPIQADRYVPLRAGERLYVQAPFKGGMMTFRTCVMARDGESHELVLESPEHVRKSERRTEPRLTELQGEDALIDGEPGAVVDLSAAGACLLSRKRPAAGQRVHVVLPCSDLDAMGWALDATPAAIGQNQGYRVRVQFTEPLAGLSKRR